jgi:sulfate/thiosulfate transport system permease protein
MTSPSAEIPAPPKRRPRPVSSGRLTSASGLGLGVGVLWLSLIVLLPIASIVVVAFQSGFGEFWDSVTQDNALDAIRLSVGAAVLVTVINAVFGTLVAWVLVRDSFWGKRALEVVIDVPFALPTIVAGLVLLSLYGAGSPLGLQWANTPHAVTLAFLFVTLPFVVRTVQPVLMEIEPEVEEAAASLGAGRFTVFRLVILPSLAPAITSGAALAFARAISEYGSLVLLSGNLPYSTEVASVRILSFIEGDQLTSAAAVASLLLLVALVVIVGLEIVSRRVARHD